MEQDRTYDLRVERKTTFKNNRLWEELQKGGLSVNAFCKENGLVGARVYKLLNLKIKPYYVKGPLAGKLIPSAEKLVKVLNVPSLELFSPELYEHVGFLVPQTAVLLANSVEFVALKEAANCQAPELLESGAMEAERRVAVERTLRTLQSREAEIIRMRFGIGEEERTQREVAKHFGVTSVRIYQLEMKALRKLMHPARKALLQAHA
jgi:RNA polymerase sigma factor (sigma-70 family)